MNFSAVILAGGRSRRMGRDKAGPQFDGQTLLTREALAVRAFAEHSRQAGLVRLLDLDRVCLSCFGNRNSPEDILPSLGADGTPVKI